MDKYGEPFGAGGFIEYYTWYALFVSAMPTRELHRWVITYRAMLSHAFEKDT